MFRKASKKQQKLRLALIGPSGSGKTYSALRIAKGFGGKIGLIDTEHGSGDLYAKEFDYETDQIIKPFSPEKYLEKLLEAEMHGIDILIVDSLTHAWTGAGGLLEMADKMAGNSKTPFGGWKEAGPIYNKLVEGLLSYNGHLICTLRTKTAYEIQTNDRGKKVPVKIGLQPVQRDGLEYEFTIVLDIESETHMAKSSKDRTQLFPNGAPFLATEETGRILRTWIESGDSPQEIFEALSEEAGLVVDKRAWYKESLPLINLLPKELQDQLVEKLKQLAV